MMRSATPLGECMTATVAAVLPELVAPAPPAAEPMDTGAAAAAEDGAAAPAAAAAEKKDPWEKQLLEHSLFRVLGAPRLVPPCAFCVRAARALTHAKTAPLSPARADALMREANEAKAPLMGRSGAEVTRLLDMTLFLCEQCAPLTLSLISAHTHTRTTRTAHSALTHAPLGAQGHYD